jgi:N-dimethylarginine dimethylaminohydrolase
MPIDPSTHFRPSVHPGAGALTEVGPLRQLVLKHAQDAFGTLGQIADEWRALNFTAPPQLSRAVDEYDQFLDLVSRPGTEVRLLPAASGTGLDSIYVRDASIVTPKGVVLCRMGKPLRANEPAAQDRAFLEWGIKVAGAIRDPGRLEGGDVVWLTPRIVAVGLGYRTNEAGIAQLRRLLGDSVDELIIVPLPHYKGADDVFHLMSMLSPVDRDLAVVYSRLMPVHFRNRLLDLGYRFVEVPDDEFESMGANVLAVSPRRAVVVAGNPRTRKLLEAAGAEVLVYSGLEISLKGGGGPTCLTRPIVRGEI